MKTLTSQKMLRSLGVVLGLLIVGFLGVAPWITIAAIMAFHFVLTFALPSNFYSKNHRLASVGILVFVGGVVVFVLTSLLDNIPYVGWAYLVWWAISVAVGVLWPFPFLKEAIANTADG